MLRKFSVGWCGLGKKMGSKRDPLSARQNRPRLCPFLRQGKRDDNVNRSNGKGKSDGNDNGKWPS
jgi:hypothetical protein